MTTKTINTCDVIVNEEEYRAMLNSPIGQAQHYQNALCGKPAITDSDHTPFAIMHGKNIFHVCAECAQLPLVEILHKAKLLAEV